MRWWYASNSGVRWSVLVRHAICPCAPRVGLRHPVVKSGAWNHEAALSFIRPISVSRWGRAAGSPRARQERPKKKPRARFANRAAQRRPRCYY
jgi:hypothetical protein